MQPRSYQWATPLCRSARTFLRPTNIPGLIHCLQARVRFGGDAESHKIRERIRAVPLVPIAAFGRMLGNRGLWLNRAERFELNL